jgi:DAK2 domain fusion protein YloV
VAEGTALDEASLAALLHRVHARLAAHRTEVDELNVFPVPDGDTGTNMVMTLRATLDGLDGDGDEPICRAVTRAAMRGARGNSGVILSQILRALAEVAADAGPLDGAGVARFLERARDLAYDAVAEPVEGTILTAVAAAASAARDTASASGDAGRVLAEVRRAVHDAVERTPRQLEALRTAGVVDAGARGFELVVEAIHGHVTGATPEPGTANPAAVCRARGEVPLADAGTLTYRFEVQYLLDAPEAAGPVLRRALERLGDSVVVVAAGDLVTVHVHTDDVGAAIEAGLEHGRPSRIEVTYFAEQISAREQADLEGTAATATSAASAPVRLGCVVVLPGPGLRTLAEDVGATVVEGGPGALPSVADLLNAVGEVRAERVVVLPGHPNIVPTAHQASDVSVAEGGRTIDVVEQADTTPAVLAALAVADPHADPEDVLDDMVEAAGAVTAGEVVAAVRDASTPLGPVREGQYLAVADGEVVAASDDAVAAVRAVVEVCGREGCDLVTLVLGAGVEDDEAAAAEEAVRAVAPGAEVQVVVGGQRPARYLLGVE